MSSQNKLMQERFEKYLAIKQETDREIFRKLTLLIYSLESGSDNDLYIIAKKLPKQYLDELIDYYDGDVLKLPSKEEYRRCNLLAIAFFLKEIYKDEEGNSLNWTEIKNIMSLPENDKEMISSISLGRRINEIKDSFSELLANLEYHKTEEKLYQIMNELKDKDIDIDEILKEVE